MSPQVHLGRASIGADHLLEILVDLAVALQPEWRDQQALLEKVGSVAAIGARHFAAEVGLVRDVADESHQFAVDEDR